MAEPVKHTRRYQSPRRQAQAAATRGDILAAAQTLFERDGYATTTMAAIAAEARVSLKTVYLGFETKRGVLRALWHLRLRGDEHQESVGERDWYRQVLEEPDPRRQLRLNARNSRAVKERAAAVTEVIRGAAAVDPNIDALWTRIQTEFRDNQRAIIESIDDKQALNDSLDIDRATDILWTINHPALWQLLVIQRGWTPTDYEHWLAETSCAQLIKNRKRAPARQPTARPARQ
jgi:AcrR family transcriptional regulator